MNLKLRRFKLKISSFVFIRQFKIIILTFSGHNEIDWACLRTFRCHDINFNSFDKFYCCILASSRCPPVATSLSIEIKYRVMLSGQQWCRWSFITFSIKISSLAISPTSFNYSRQWNFHRVESTLNFLGEMSGPRLKSHQTSALWIFPLSAIEIDSFVVYENRKFRSRSSHDIFLYQKTFPRFLSPFLNLSLSGLVLNSFEYKFCDSV